MTDSRPDDMTANTVADNPMNIPANIPVGNEAGHTVIGTVAELMARDPVTISADAR